jgi:ubiquinone/menaquinone biosynthesis C-methylase UbiE
MTSGKDPSARYVPAAGRDALTSGYDRVLALTMRERRWRPLMVERIAALTPGAGRILDVGAGTGTLAIALAAARPDASVVAVDGDPKVLDLARHKAGADRVEWRQGLAGELDVDDASADAAVMSLLLHHLEPAAKLRALHDVRRVLRPAGRLFVADWGRPHDPAMRAAFGVLQLIDGFDGTRDHAAGRLPALIRAAGFRTIERYGRLRTGWGTLEMFDAGT